MAILLAILAGGLLGYVLERGDLCFHSTWRGLLRKPRQVDLVRSYLLLLLISVPAVQLLKALGWIDPWIPPFVWRANLAGGLVFGVGMVVASTCVTGMFYKFGHGMLGTAVAIAGWAIGDVVTYNGPLSFLRDELNADPVTVNGETATLGNALGPFGPILLIAVGVAVAAYLYSNRASPGARSRGKLWGWMPLGLAMAAVTSVAWLLVNVEGSDYSFGTSGVPTTVWDALSGSREAGASIWIPLALVSIVPGAFVAAKLAGTLWIRGEDTRRYLQLGSGGLLMGAGAAVAGGCNLGHSIVGVPLLSLGSITTTIAMIVGVFGAHYAAKLMGSAEAKPDQSRQPSHQPT
ncbi:MAG: YeeE/YedE family protein [Actinobacteria bacterium]|nr:YeeE/YedE family protein [Actinomycetota bacterium]